MTIYELLRYGRSLETVKIQVTNMHSTNAENRVNKTIEICEQQTKLRENIF